ncbi:MAG: DUF2511 domain-containing protein [Caulobacteraceae bacterium]
MKIRTALLCAATLLALAGCNRNGASLSAQDVGPQWPFTVSDVRVVCAPTLAMFVTADGKAYPVNGQAERHPDLYKQGPVSSLNDILKVDPQVSKLTPDARMSLDAFTQKAIEVCTKAGPLGSSQGVSQAGKGIGGGSGFDFGRCETPQSG